MVKLRDYSDDGPRFEKIRRVARLNFEEIETRRRKSEKELVVSKPYVRVNFDQTMARQPSTLVPFEGIKDLRLRITPRELLEVQRAAFRANEGHHIWPDTSALIRSGRNGVLMGRFLGRTVSIRDYSFIYACSEGLTETYPEVVPLQTEVEGIIEVERANLEGLVERKDVSILPGVLGQLEAGTAVLETSKRAHKTEGRTRYAFLIEQELDFLYKFLDRARKKIEQDKLAYPGEDILLGETVKEFGRHFGLIHERQHPKRRVVDPDLDVLVHAFGATIGNGAYNTIITRNNKMMEYILKMEEMSKSRIFNEGSFIPRVVVEMEEVPETGVRPYYRATVKRAR